MELNPDISVCEMTPSPLASHTVTDMCVECQMLTSGDGVAERGACSFQERRKKKDYLITTPAPINVRLRKDDVRGKAWNCTGRVVGPECR